MVFRPWSRLSSDLVANEAPHNDVLAQLCHRALDPILDRLRGILHIGLLQQHNLFVKLLGLLIGWDGVVLDLSGRHQLFTGALRHAAQLSKTGCYWPACSITVSHCEIDHLQPRREDGRTNPGNGAPACGYHNRRKEDGFTVTRDERGRTHIYRPDGTEIHTVRPAPANDGELVSAG